MNRREFVTAVATLAIGLRYTPMLGEETGGGLYVPAPADLHRYVRIEEPQPLEAHLAQRQHAWAMVLWARPGAAFGDVQLIMARHVFRDRTWENPARRRAAEINLVESIRHVWEEDHIPGWLNTVQSSPDDAPSIRKWERVGHLKWITPEQWQNMRTIVVPPAAARV